MKLLVLNEGFLEGCSVVLAHRSASTSLAFAKFIGSSVEISFADLRYGDLEVFVVPFWIDVTLVLLIEGANVV